MAKEASQICRQQLKRCGNTISPRNHHRAGDFRQTELEEQVAPYRQIRYKELQLALVGEDILLQGILL